MQVDMKFVEWRKACLVAEEIQQAVVSPALSSSDEEKEVTLARSNGGEYGTSARTKSDPG
jgi:hypothetical protein